MIVYEVKRNKGISIVEVPPTSPQGTGVFQRWRAPRAPQAASLQIANNEVALARALAPSEVPELPAMGMGKTQYALWLNAHVYPYFQKGTKVTLRRQPMVVGKPPEVWFEVADIQEIHYHVMQDRETRQPRAVGCKVAGDTSITLVYYPPKVLRPLLKQEIEALDSLRNQASSGRIIENEGNVLVDDGTNDHYVG